MFNKPYFSKTRLKKAGKKLFDYTFKCRGKRLVTMIMFLIVVLLLWNCWMVFIKPFSTATKISHLYVDKDDNIDSVEYKLSKITNSSTMFYFSLLSNISNYKSRISCGHYEISVSQSTFKTLKDLRGGHQKPVRIVVPSVWTKEMALGQISRKLMIDSVSLVKTFNTEAECRKYGLDTSTVVSLLIPNSYDVYWNISGEDFLKRMFKESNRFWNSSRTEKLRRLEMTKLQVVTLASIVDAETTNNEEKPIIAGLYINRLKTGMPLQSCPTIKYALRDFGLKRIYEKMLLIESPYNTYRNKGLPPGPIRIPQISSIDAVLDYSKHDYLYMCAKEDFSGTHNFAATYKEHQKNAQRYSKVLDSRNKVSN